jgi:hypothetical protein
MFTQTQPILHCYWPAREAKGHSNRLPLATNSPIFLPTTVRHDTTTPLVPLVSMMTGREVGRVGLKLT